MSRPMTYDWKRSPKLLIVMPKDRGEALSRVASQLGCSRHVLIQRFISLGLSVFDEGA